MTDLAIAIDGIRGEVKITITKPDDTQVLKFKWYKADDESTGFISSATQSPMPVTELAAEMFIKIVVANLAKVLEVDPGTVKIFNHLGDQLNEIEFMPPTFDGKEADVQKFVAMQDSLKNLYSAYEEDYHLCSDIIEACEQSDVLDHFLSLVQLQLSKTVFTFSTPKE